MKIDIAQIKELAEAMKETGLTKLEAHNKDGETLILEAQAPAIVTAPPIPMPAPAAASPKAAETVPAKEPKEEGVRVTSPLVGTAYLAPAQDKPNFVSVGAEVKKGDVVCIVESMKMLNDITAVCDGTVTKVCVLNGELVEYGQPLVLIKPKA